MLLFCLYRYKLLLNDNSLIFCTDTAPTESYTYCHTLPLHYALPIYARVRQGELTKPAGSLGRLEDLAIFFAGWQGRTRPRIERARAAIFAGNHGVTVHGVSAFPPSVTAQMVANFARGGAASNALSDARSEEHTSELQSLMRIPDAGFCLKKKKRK